MVVAIVTPGAATSTLLPVLDHDASVSVLSVALTFKKYGLSAVESNRPSLPAELTTTPPFDSKYWAAVLNEIRVEALSKLRLATRAPWSAAQVRPLASADAEA